MTTTSFDVTSENGTSSTDLSGLNNVIQSIDVGGANAATGTNYVITVTGLIDLTSDLTAINLASGSTLTIVGVDSAGNPAIATIDGLGDQRGFFVYSGNVTLENLLVENATAQGGAGGGGGSGGGGGAGLGGGLFVAAGANVSLDNVSFLDDAAKGGAGGVPNYFGTGGGGGGMGGDGGQGAANSGSPSKGITRGNGGGGGGGLGLGADGGDAGAAGDAGIVPGVASGGGHGGSPGTLPFVFGAGGGIAPTPGNTETAGGGGFGGGGGGGAEIGGQGGFGGGGGGGLVGGGGGFGGGGGGGAISGGHGGFGGGNGAEQVGGGGLGAGGDIFVEQGGTLTIEAGSLSGGSVAGGAGGAIPGVAPATAHAGSAYGSGIFIQGNQTITFAPASGEVLTVSDVIADQSGSGGTGANAGIGNVSIDGAGTVVYAAHDTYVGLTTIEQGKLVLAAGGAVAAKSGLDLSGADATFDMSAAGNQTVGDFSGVAGSQVLLGANSLTVGGAASTSFDGAIAGNGALIKQGGGVLTLGGDNSFSGGTLLRQGTLEVSSTNALGTGPVAFAANTTDTLVIDDTALTAHAFGTTVSGFGMGDSIDLKGLHWDALDNSAVFDNGTLSIESGGVTDTLTLSGSYTSDQFVLSADSNGGTLVSVIDTAGSEAALNAAIAAADAAASGNYIIRLTGNIALGSDLTAINLKSGVTLTIEGEGNAIDGQDSTRGFFVYAGNVTIEDLTIENTVAKGGAGMSGGGGGAGLGGGLFIAGTSSGTGGHVTLDNVAFVNDSAQGGAGGAAGAAGLGGGGGLGGAGGAGENQRLPAENGGGGGGGIGSTASGGSLAGSGGSGIIPGAAGGGAGGVFVTSGSAHAGAGGASGGGGGAGFNAGGGGGGIGGFAGWNTSGGGGGPGGFGGGGGGSQFVHGSGGSGGFGGGGGAGYYFGGYGGFGGGGGGGDATGGSGGFGAGNGSGGSTSKLTHGGGGGGLGAGGDIFVQQGGSLTITDGNLGSGTVTGGAAGDSNAGTGSAYGSGIFLQGDETITLGAGQGATDVTIISGVIADQNGSGGSGWNAGAGSLVIDGNGVVKLNAVNTYTGGTTIAGGTLELGNAGAAGSGAIKFAGPSTLQIDHALMPINTISGFTAGDDIFLSSVTNVAVGHADMNYATNVLTITEGDDHYRLHFDPTEDFSGEYFHLTSVDDGTEITESSVACYCRGTLIETKHGAKAIETLKIGDEVATVSGAVRPIKWIGRRSYGGRFIMGRKDILPICIKAGALADNVPARDLWLSPRHAMYFQTATQGGVLIEAKDLVNGASIVQAQRAGKVEYFHIELDGHDAIFAEGAPSESFIDDDSRAMFHNAHEFHALYPDAAVPARYCAPRLEDGYELEEIRLAIARRAGRARLARRGQAA